MYKKITYPDIQDEGLLVIHYDGPKKFRGVHTITGASYTAKHRAYVQTWYEELEAKRRKTNAGLTENAGNKTPAAQRRDYELAREWLTKPW